MGKFRVKGLLVKHCNSCKQTKVKYLLLYFSPSGLATTPGISSPNSVFSAVECVQRKSNKAVLIIWQPRVCKLTRLQFQGNMLIVRGEYITSI